MFQKCVFKLIHIYLKKNCNPIVCKNYYLLICDIIFKKSVSEKILKNVYYNTSFIHILKLLTDQTFE